MNKYIVMTAVAKLSKKSGGNNYKKVAVVETNGVDMPAYIDQRHKAVISIAYNSGPVFAGKGKNSRFNLELAKAKAICAELNFENKRTWDEINRPCEMI